MKFHHVLGILSACAISLLAIEQFVHTKTDLPDIKMAQNGLPFSLIEAYPQYRVIATHYRTDKHELRYILVNPTAFNALQAKKNVLPDGSIIVKIGWSVKPMSSFNAALEADVLQRIEYMYKDTKRFNHNGDHWGYARFVKKNGVYSSWEGDTQSCVACHSSVKASDYLFTQLQQTF